GVGTGTGGNITLTTSIGNVSIAGRLSANGGPTNGGGNITVTAPNGILTVGAGGITADAIGTGSYNAGNIQIEALSVNDNGGISANRAGSGFGNGGNIQVTAQGPVFINGDAVANGGNGGDIEFVVNTTSVFQIGAGSTINGINGVISAQGAFSNGQL